MAEYEVTTMHKAVVVERWLVDVPADVVAEGHAAIKAWLNDAADDQVQGVWPETTIDYWTETESETTVGDYRPVEGGEGWDGG